MSEPINIAEVRELFAKTTQGEWVPRRDMSHEYGDDEEEDFLSEIADGVQVDGTAVCVAWCEREDSAWIAKAHNDCPAMLDELENHRRWKTAAMAALTQWDDAWEAACKPGASGQSKAIATMREIERLRAKVAELKQQSQPVEAEIAEREKPVTEPWRDAPDGPGKWWVKSVDQQIDTIDIDTPGMKVFAGGNGWRWQRVIGPR